MRMKDIQRVCIVGLDIRKKRFFLIEEIELQENLLGIFGRCLVSIKIRAIYSPIIPT